MSSVSGLQHLSRDLGAVADGVALNIEKVVTTTAALVKDGWNGKLYTEGHADRTGRSITYSVGVAHEFALFATSEADVTSSTIVAEIGPRRGSGKQAGIVRLLENGSIHNAPHGYGAAALHEREGDYEAGIAFAEWAAAKARGL